MLDLFWLLLTLAVVCTWGPRVWRRLVVPLELPSYESRRLQRYVRERPRVRQVEAPATERPTIVEPAEQADWQPDADELKCLMKQLDPRNMSPKETRRMAFFILEHAIR